MLVHSIFFFKFGLLGKGKFAGSRGSLILRSLLIRTTRKLEKFAGSRGYSIQLSPLTGGYKLPAITLFFVIFFLLFSLSSHTRNPWSPLDDCSPRSHELLSSSLLRLFLNSSLGNHFPLLFLLFTGIHFDLYLGF